MNPPRCDEYDYINFFIAAQRAFSCLEAARVQPKKENSPSHDSINRLLHRLKPEPASLWEEAGHYITPGKGFFVIDDSTPDKLYARKIELVSGHWSGKHHGVLQGINLVTLLRTDGDAHIPCDVRVHYKQQDGKNQKRSLSRYAFQSEIQRIFP